MIEKETISGKEFMKIYRAEKGIPEPEEKSEEETAKPQEDSFFAQKEDSFFENSVLGEKEDSKEQKPEGNRDSFLKEESREKEEIPESLQKRKKKRKMRKIAETQAG